MRGKLDVNDRTHATRKPPPATRARSGGTKFTRFKNELWGSQKKRNTKRLQNKKGKKKKLKESENKTKKKRGKRGKV